MATTFEQGNFKFEIIDEKKKTVRIMRRSEYTDFNGKLVIPSSVTQDGKTFSVIEIGGLVRPYIAAAYKKVPDKRIKEGYRKELVWNSRPEVYGFEETNITEVVIPDSVVIIGERAFHLCRKLNKVHFSKNLQEIHEDAFGSTNFDKITIPGTVNVLGYRCFSGTKIKKLVIEKGVKEIKNRAFDGAILECVDIPASVDKIEGDSSFTFGKTIKKVIIDDSDGVISIGKNAFPESCEIIYKSQMGFFCKLFH